MKRTPENDGDGVDREDTTAVHENVRESEDGVEKAPERGDGLGEPATGLIGNGAGVDPRYISQR